MFPKTPGRGSTLKKKTPNTNPSIIYRSLPLFLQSTCHWAKISTFLSPDYLIRPSPRACSLRRASGEKWSNPEKLYIVSYNDDLIKRKNSPKVVLVYSDKKAISLCQGPTVKPLHQTLSFFRPVWRPAGVMELVGTEAFPLLRFFSSIRFKNGSMLLYWCWCRNSERPRCSSG